MDLISAFKSELLRPLATLIVPGAVSIGPFIIIVGYYVRQVPKFWNDHPSAFVAIIIICVLGLGMILENFGSQVEAGIWDKILNKRDPSHNSTWDEYLKLEMKDEVVGQRYLRTVLLRMKFELSMGPALITLSIGLIWINSLYAVWQWWSAIVLFFGLMILAGYLIYESFSSAKILASTRKCVVEAVRNRPTRPVK
jgi:putative Mn2+ efflux pump MntP